MYFYCRHCATITSVRAIDQGDVQRFHCHDNDWIQLQCVSRSQVEELTSHGRVVLNYHSIPLYTREDMLHMRGEYESGLRRFNEESYAPAQFKPSKAQIVDWDRELRTLMQEGK